MTVYNYVQGDTGPQLRLVLTREESGDAVDLTDATATLHFRAAGSTTLLFSRPFVIPPDTATTGLAVLQWQASDLDRAAGAYEGELEVVLASGIRETQYRVLKFRIRADFG